MKWNALTVLLLTGTPVSAVDIPLGIEAVTGLRSDYVYRGFRLSGTTLDFQLEAEIAKNKDNLFHLGGFYLAGGGDDFREAGIYLDYTHLLTEKLELGASLTYQDYQNSVLRSGLELGLSVDFRFTDDWDINSSIFYDFESTGWYGETSVGWSTVLTKSAFISSKTGLSYTSDYFGRSGLNDAFSKLGLTYEISSSVAFTPYLGVSIPLHSDQGENEVYAGLNFEVLF